MPSTLMDYNADRFSETGKMPALGRGKQATKIRKRILKKAMEAEKVEKARKMLKKMGESGSEIRRKRQKDRARSAGMILADEDTTTEPGAVDDDAKKRMEERKKRLAEAAG